MKIRTAHYVCEFIPVYYLHGFTGMMKIKNRIAISGLKMGRLKLFKGLLIECVTEFLFKRLKFCGANYFIV